MVDDLEQKAKMALGFIPISGLDKINERYREALQYGLEREFFTQKDIDKAQEQYITSHKKGLK